MKKLFYIFVFFLPVIVNAQFDFYKDSPLDYAWKNVGNAGFSAGLADYTSLAFSPSGQPYVAFEDWANSKKATVMKFNGTNWVNVGNAGFSSGQVMYLSIAISPSGQPYVSYDYLSNGANWVPIVKKFDGTNWVDVGNSSLDAIAVYSNCLAFSPAGVLYLALEGPGTGRARVMKFDGINWVNVGNPGFSAGTAYFVSLEFSPSDSLPYVAHQDSWSSNKATVMKFDGTNWILVGKEGFTAGGIDEISLAVSPSGEPYVAFSDNFNYDLMMVMKYNGTDWVYVGNGGISAGEAYFPSLAFSPTGEPYLAFNTEEYSYKATVKKFNGTSWVNLGTGGFSAGVGKYESLAFSPYDGKPYVAYQDWSIGGKATVMKYDTVSFGISELNQSQISLYPNPATDKITIETFPTTIKSQLLITNLNGQEIITRQITELKTQIDISNLPAGIYFVRLTSDKTVEVGKIIKQ